MDPTTTGAIIAGGSAVVNSGLGMLGAGGGNHAMRKNMRYQLKMQKNLWDYTNAENQVKHYENAGLNVGLMYGKGGAGGTTAGSFAGGGQAPMMGQFDMMQAQAIQSQIELNRAQADKAKAEADKTRGADTDMTIEQSKGIGLDNMFKSGNLGTALDTSKQLLENEKSKNVVLVNEGKISEAEANNRDTQLKVEIGNKVVDTLLKEAQTKNVDQKTIESIESIKQRWTEISQGFTRLDQEQQKIEIEKFKADFNAQYPAVSNAMGNIVDEGIRGIWQIFGMNYDSNSKHKKMK
jgi:hypothetical protein